MPTVKDGLKDRLARYRQIKISVTGRKSGNTISVPVWSLLSHATLSLNLLASLTLEQAKKLADTLNETVLDASVAVSREHPMFAGKFSSASKPS